MENILIDFKHIQIHMENIYHCLNTHKYPRKTFSSLSKHTQIYMENILIVV